MKGTEGENVYLKDAAIKVQTVIINKYSIIKHGRKVSKLGNYPSYTCMSIWATKKLPQEGMAKIVGRGDCISIWQDAWIPGLKD
ncbi:hypothetical protein J1N35_022459 [Gossypium stocksii]|uniref:Uncharacterized protein n=1 Tax=Gossypium stocksii TaxID=47602 RepID=A0A9D3VGT0_9ROSI|nr:hypothetical protein J1N35_022459 [Gossypium stocksii]